ncbi:MAG: disulfide oxidoreductase [Candidatus Coatesbacteria bacterium]|nr:disulfide oxidoreductase [Candidatus Coatesbacteria bacterium]
MNEGAVYTAATLVADVLKGPPGPAGVLKRHADADCTNCPAAAEATLELYALLHGLELEELLAELNAASPTR